MATLPKSPPRAQRISTATVDSGMLGEGIQALGRGVGRGLEAVEDGETKQVQAAIAGIRTKFDPAFQKAVASYDGYAPNFANDQIGAYDAEVEAVRSGLSPSARLKFDEVNLDQRLGVVQRASQVEASAQGERERQARAADQSSRLEAQQAGFTVETQSAVRDAFTSDDPTAPDFLARQLVAFDERSRGALDAAREEDRPLMQKWLSNQRANLQITLAGTGRNLQDARIVNQVKTSLTTLANGVTADPASLWGAIEKGKSAVAALPADVRENMAKAVPVDMVNAALGGMLVREDYYGVDAALKDKRIKAILPPDQYAQFQARSTQALTSEKRLLAKQTVQDRLAAELVSITQTGQGTGFDPKSIMEAYGPIEGPAAVAEAKKSIASARVVRDLTYDFPALTPKDQQARLDMLKPAPGDPDFANKQKIYDAALAQAQTLAQKRLVDPAGAVLADKSAAGLWRETQDGAAQSAQAWATDTLRRQAAMGISPEQRRVLPADEAKRLVKTVVGTKDPVGKGEAMSGLYAYADKFGPESGRVLMELQRAGLPPAEAAVLNASDGDPVAISSYARALERAPQVKLTSAQVTQLNNAVLAELKPLVQSYGGSQDGMAYGNALGYAITTMARANMGDDLSVKEAARAAAKSFLGRYAFGTGTGARIPAEQAGQDIKVMRGRDAEDAFVRQGDTALWGVLPVGKITDGGGLVSRGALFDGAADLPGGDITVKGDRAAEMGAYRALRDLVKDGGKGLYPVGVPGSPLDEGGKRGNYAQQVGHQGKWVTTADDAGLMLMLRDPRGGYVPVIEASGKPVVRTWSQLFQRAGRP